jgi:hypothetical protein
MQANGLCEFNRAFFRVPSASPCIYCDLKDLLIIHHIPPETVHEGVFEAILPLSRHAFFSIRRSNRQSNHWSNRWNHAGWERG